MYLSSYFYLFFVFLYFHSLRSWYPFNILSLFHFEYTNEKLFLVPKRKKETKTKKNYYHCSYLHMLIFQNIFSTYPQNRSNFVIICHLRDVPFEQELYGIVSSKKFQYMNCTQNKCRIRMWEYEIHNDKLKSYYLYFIFLSNGFWGYDLTFYCWKKDLVDKIGC